MSFALALVPVGPITSLSAPLLDAQTAQHFGVRSQSGDLQPRLQGTRSKVLGDWVGFLPGPSDSVSPLPGRFSTSAHRPPGIASRRPPPREPSAPQALFAHNP